MKKLFAFLISMNFAFMPAYCTITDDFAEATLDKNLKIKSALNQKISDDFVEKSLDKNLKIKPYKKYNIADSFAENNKSKNVSYKKIIDLQEVIPQNNTSVKHKKITIFDINSAIEVPIKPQKLYSTRQKAEEGDYIDFETTKDVKIKGKLYSKGTTVKARVENISQNKSMGIPSDLVVGNFSINGTPLAGEISKTGANRSLWVYPCVYFFMPFFCAGLLFIPIRGGHAKIRTSEIFTLYFK